MDDKVVLGCSRPDFEGGFNTRLWMERIDIKRTGNI